MRSVLDLAQWLGTQRGLVLPLNTQEYCMSVDLGTASIFAFSLVRERIDGALEIELASSFHLPNARVLASSPWRRALHVLPLLGK